MYESNEMKCCKQLNIEQISSIANSEKREPPK